MGIILPGVCPFFIGFAQKRRSENLCAFQLLKLPVTKLRHRYYCDAPV